MSNTIIGEHSGSFKTEGSVGMLESRSFLINREGLSNASFEAEGRPGSISLRKIYDASYSAEIVRAGNSPYPSNNYNLGGLYGSSYTNNSAPVISLLGPKTLNILSPSFYQRPSWMSQDVPIDQDGRIWAIQCIVGRRGQAATNLGDPWSHDLPFRDFGASVSFYVILRNDSIPGAGASFAPYSSANPIEGWDVGIPSTHTFAKEYYGYTGLQYPGLIGMIIPAGWEFIVYRYAGYSSLRYTYNSSTRFIDNQWAASTVNVSSSNYQISNNVLVSEEIGSHNNRGVMTMWDKQNGAYDQPDGGYSYLFKKIPMPAGYA